MRAKQDTRDPQDGMYMRGDDFQVIASVMACTGSKPIYLGVAGMCRFCGAADSAKFKKKAHTIPEAFGNKSVFSVDECDDCNQWFSRYEGALAASVGPFLTLGGVKGKANSVRQTGRSAGPVYAKHSLIDGQRSIFTMVDGLETEFSRDPASGLMMLTFPVADERFRPLDAHKALLKIGYALLPEDERGQFDGLRSALRASAAPIGQAPQPVGLSFAAVGSSPPFVSAALVRGMSPRLPRTFVVVAAGSVCAITQLRSDADESQSMPLTSISLNWTTCLRWGGADDSFTVRHADPLYFDWSSADMVVQPVAAITLKFDQLTTQATFTPVFRDSSPHI